jgi:hypothetical protein
MTTAYFDVPASNTPALRYARPPHVQSDGIAFRTIRLIWLTAQLVSCKPLTFVDYRRRFGVSLRSFRRDIALLRAAGLFIETVTHGDYRLLSFAPDYDAA